MSTLNMLRAARALALMVVAVAGASTTAQTIGEVEFVRGAGLLQTGSQNARILGPGLALQEGDRLSTADDSLAIVRLQDGTRLTLRPQTELLLQQYRYRESAADNRMQLQLLRGGVRALTGSISKQSPDAALLHTPVGRLHIRGTDFDARLCVRDCAAQTGAVREAPRALAMRASAKVALVQGPLSVVDSAGATHGLVKGGSIYPGDTVHTGANTTAVLAFRDESRVTLGPATRFRVDDFVFDKSNQAEGHFLVSLLRGSLRALTGLIGKANNRRVNFGAVTATIGIRGTGLDLDCSLDASCSFFDWLGAIEVTPLGQSQGQILQVGQGLLVRAGEVRPLQGSTLEHLVRPDLVDIDVDELFSDADLLADEDGLYVWVRDGHIELTGAHNTLHLGRGETGFVSLSAKAVRPRLQPLFQEFDATPLPNARNPAVHSLLLDLGVRNVQQCQP